MVGILVRGCMYARSWCDLDLTFDLAVMTLPFKFLSKLYLGNRKVEEVGILYGYWIRGVPVRYHM